MLTNQFIDVGSVKTRYWQAGSEGSAVLLLHGIACSVTEWESNIEALAVRHRVFAVDLLGFGLTDKPADETYSLRRLANCFGLHDGQGAGASAHGGQLVGWAAGAGVRCHRTAARYLALAGGPCGHGATRHAA